MCTDLALGTYPHPTPGSGGQRTEPNGTLYYDGWCGLLSWMTKTLFPRFRSLRARAHGDIEDDNPVGRDDCAPSHGRR